MGLALVHRDPPGGERRARLAEVAVSVRVLGGVLIVLGRRVDELDDAELERIRRRLAAIIKKAVAVNSVSSRFPRNWLFHHRWGRPEDARTSRGEPIEITTVAGRTTAWVPSVQR